MPVGADLGAEVLPILTGVGFAPMRWARMEAWPKNDGGPPSGSHIPRARVVRLDAHSPALGRHTFVLLGDQVADAGGAVTGKAQALHLKTERAKLDRSDA